MIKRFVWLCLLPLMSGCVQNTTIESSEIPDDTIELLRRGKWRVLGHKYQGNAMDSIYVTHAGRCRYVYNVGHIDGWEGCWRLVDLAYDKLAARRGPQPSAFSDITGDGHANLVLIERVCGMNHTHPYLITVLSLEGENVTTVGHIQSEGEIFYFHDWDMDGRFEFVGTAGERDFKFNDSGIPLDPLVWRLGKSGYLPTGSSGLMLFRGVNR